RILHGVADHGGLNCSVRAGDGHAYLLVLLDEASPEGHVRSLVRKTVVVDLEPSPAHPVGPGQGAAYHGGLNRSVRAADDHTDLVVWLEEARPEGHVGTRLRARLNQAHDPTPTTAIRVGTGQGAAHHGGLNGSIRAAHEQARVMVVLDEAGPERQ